MFATENTEGTEGTEGTEMKVHTALKDAFLSVCSVPSVAKNFSTRKV